MELDTEAARCVSDMIGIISQWTSLGKQVSKIIIGSHFLGGLPSDQILV